MKKNFAIIFAALMLALVMWGLFFENSSTTIMINGEEVVGPFKGVLGVGGLAVALIALVCLAILLALAFAGTGIVVLGCIVIGIGVFSAFMLPFILPIFIPLALVWLFITLMRNKN